jgi:ATP/maltotriose-dependent transcriptional regulator MalT
MPGDKNLGITISRTLIPTLPSGYLSRKHLFPLIDNDSSGTTFLIAPGGYGKTALVTEWAQSQSKGVIWMTLAHGDTINEMSAMMIAATRHVIPGFAPWFEKEQPLRPTELVRRWGNELLQTGREFVFVIDNLRSDEGKDIEIAVQLVEQFPRNIHFIAIRRDNVESLYATCASHGPIKTLSINELRFSHDEIERYAITSGLTLNEESRKFLQSANGWPSATSLLRANLQTHGENIDIAQLIASNVEPLRALGLIVIKNLDPKILHACARLSVLPVFTLSEAKLVLGDNFSADLINSIALKGEIFTMSRKAQGGYIFSPMVRQIFLEILGNEPQEKIAIHNLLIKHFEDLGRPSSAIDHAFQAGNEPKIHELFPNAARGKQAQGRGGELIRWSEMAGDSSVEGQLKRATVKATGHLADLDFSSAQAEISRIGVLADGLPMSEFFTQFTAAASMYSMLTLARFDDLENFYLKTRVGTPECYLGVDDQINVIRVLATKRYIWNDADGVEELFEKAQELAAQTNLVTSHSFLNAINAMYLHQKGDYRRAYEAASMARAQIEHNEFVGNHGPLDVMYVSARALLEFSRPLEAISIFEEIKAKAFQWKQWHWYIACDDNICQFITYNGKPREALDRIKESRNFIESLEPVNNLNMLVDINEMNIRRRMKDYDRLEKLVNRAPNIRNTQQFRMVLDEVRGRKSYSTTVKNLPDKYPRDLIWKYLSEAEMHMESENLALQSMKSAMLVGAEVGARETFLRQSDEMGNLVIKVASEFPTVYNEDLATAMAERMKERGNQMTTGHQSLTKRELEILRQLSTGRTLTIIAGELHISQNTMKTHLKNLYKKLEADGRNDAVEKAKALFLL